MIYSVVSQSYSAVLLTAVSGVFRVLLFPCCCTAGTELHGLWFRIQKMAVPACLCSNFLIFHQTGGFFFLNYRSLFSWLCCCGSTRDFPWLLWSHLLLSQLSDCWIYYFSERFCGFWRGGSHSKLRQCHLVPRGQNCLCASLHATVNTTDLQWALCVIDVIWPSGTHSVWERKPLKCLWLRIKVPRYEGCRGRSQVSRADVEGMEGRKSVSNNCRGHS